MTPYEMGKYAALQELGLEKDAGLGNFFTGVGRGLKNLWKGEAAATVGKRGGRAAEAARTTTKRTTTKTPPRSKRTSTMTIEEPVTVAADAPKEKGILAGLPWWVKGMGLAGAGYGGYKLLSPNTAETQMQQPYFGPGNAYPQGF